MKREEFDKKVAELKIPENWFLINEGYEEDTFCVEQVYGKWYFYYFERGNRENEQVFDNEEDVLKLLFDILLKEKKYLDSIH